MANFVIEPHSRLQEWVAEEKVTRLAVVHRRGDGLGRRHDDRLNHDRVIRMRATAFLVCARGSSADVADADAVLSG